MICDTRCSVFSVQCSGMQCDVMFVRCLVFGNRSEVRSEEQGRVGGAGVYSGPGGGSLASASSTFSSSAFSLSSSLKAYSAG